MSMIRLAATLRPSAGGQTSARQAANRFCAVLVRTFAVLSPDSLTNL